mmetsp:Transcript_77937/g.218704  ORF Transcript_77937/g.218704 Transcript_77937/m.218704 type:complete len:81 (-) Transcript_77937:192-434(-)
MAAEGPVSGDDEVGELDGDHADGTKLREWDRVELQAKAKPTKQFPARTRLEQKDLMFQHGPRRELRNGGGSVERQPELLL